jgi:hypothetical protein
MADAIIKTYSTKSQGKRSRASKKGRKMREQVAEDQS